MKSVNVFLCFSLGLLLFAISLIVYGELSVPAPRFHGNLAGLLPAPPDGWKMVERSIAETPEMEATVGRILNFDDGLFCDFRGNDSRFSLYLAYWSPGRMNYREVGSHTPDVCWVANGWVKQQAGQIDLSDFVGRKTLVGEARTFMVSDQVEYVWFWHIVGRGVKSYGGAGVPPWYSAFLDIWDKGLRQREEQFFIRISSSKPLESLLDTSPLGSILQGFPIIAEVD